MINDDDGNGESNGMLCVRSNSRCHTKDETWYVRARTIRCIMICIFTRRHSPSSRENDSFPKSAKPNIDVCSVVPTRQGAVQVVLAAKREKVAVR